LTTSGIGKLFSKLFKKKNVALPAAAEVVIVAPDRIDFDFEDRRIPDNSRKLVKTICELITDIEKRSEQQEVFCPNTIEIRMMRDVHLPKMLISYIEIPEQHRAEIFRKTGRSASYMLKEGLTKMAERLNSMSTSMAQGNIDTFTQNLRFIESRYGEEFTSFD
jgi:hypothetical protein